MTLKSNSNDHDTAADFYQTLLGWTFQPLDAFPIIRAGENGSLQVTLNPVRDLHKAGDVDLGVASDDVEADLEKAAELGAQMLQPRTETPFGSTFGIFESPDGSIIVLIEVADDDRRIGKQSAKC